MLLYLYLHFNYYFSLFEYFFQQKVFEHLHKTYLLNLTTHKNLWPHLLLLLHLARQNQICQV